MKKRIVLGGVWIAGFILILSINGFAQSTTLKRYPDVSFRKVSGEDRWISAEDGCHRNRLESVISAKRERKQVFEMLDLNGGDIEVGDFIQILCGKKFWIAENGGGGKVLIEQNPDDTERPTKFKILDILKQYDDNDRTYIWVYLQTKNGELVAIPNNGWVQANSHTPGSSDDVIEIVIHKKYIEPKPDPVSKIPSSPSGGGKTGGGTAGGSIKQCQQPLPDSERNKSTTVFTNKNWKKLKLQVVVGKGSAPESEVNCLLDTRTLNRDESWSVPCGGIDIWFRRQNDPDNPNSGWQIWTHRPCYTGTPQTYRENL